MQENKSLIEHTTFGVSASASYFAEINTIDDIHELRAHSVWGTCPAYILGGGSNILFTGNYDGIIICNKLKGITVFEDTEEYTLVDVAAGENWHEFVLWSVARDLWGVENLALIPGTVGAAPVQNIGAYGVEVGQVITEVTYIDLADGVEKTLTQSECCFGYRDSFFKQHKGDLLVTSVRFKLSKIPILNLEYAPVTDYLVEHGITLPNALDMAQAVIAIRNSKLPRVGELGMAGSFFKNPVISSEQLELLRISHPDIPYFVLDSGDVKIPAGWLIEYLGYKGVRKGEVGTYYKHALILVNYGEATGSDVWSFACNIIADVKNTFDIVLEPEVIIK